MGVSGPITPWGRLKLQPTKIKFFLSAATCPRVGGFGNVICWWPCRPPTTPKGGISWGIRFSRTHRRIFRGARKWWRPFPIRRITSVYPAPRWGSTGPRQLRRVGGKLHLRLNGVYPCEQSKRKTGRHMTRDVQGIAIMRFLENFLIPFRFVYIIIPAQLKLIY